VPLLPIVHRPRVLYRGTNNSRRIGDGISWTSDICTAASFAVAPTNQECAIHRLIEPQRIILSTRECSAEDHWDEDEYIVDTRGQQPEYMDLSEEQIMELAKECKALRTLGFDCEQRAKLSGEQRRELIAKGAPMLRAMSTLEYSLRNAA
jgi:hypothetical protein